MDDNLGGMHDQDLKKEKEELYALKKQKKNRKWKKLNTNFSFLALRVVFLVTLFEAFFIADYFLSSRFMNELQSLTDELSLLVSRQPAFTEALLAQKEVFYSDGA